MSPEGGPEAASGNLRLRRGGQSAAHRHGAVAGWQHDLERSPGGLVTALEPLLRKRRGAWIGWAGVPDSGEEPIVEDGVQLYPVELSAQDVADYYEGFSNATLWPLYHDLIVKPVYHRKWWDSYVDVNRRFAEATAALPHPGPRSGSRTISCSSSSRCCACCVPTSPSASSCTSPSRRSNCSCRCRGAPRSSKACSGADLVGFHLAGGAQNFLVLSRRLVGANTSRASIGVRSRFGEVSYGFRTVTGRGLPHFDRLRRSGRQGTQPGDSPTRPADPRRARRPTKDPARRRPARLHQRHRRPPACLHRAARRGPDQTRRHRAGPAGDTEPRAGRELHRDAGGHRTPGRSHQR